MDARRAAASSKSKTVKTKGAPVATKTARKAGRKTAAKKPVAAKRTAKKTTAKKTAARKPVNQKAAQESARVTLNERFESDGAAVVASFKKHDGDWAKIAKDTGMSAGKAQRMYVRATLAPKDRLFTKGLTDKEMGEAIVKLKDQDGLKFMPDIWARTGLGPARIQELYVKHGGGKNVADAPKRESAGGARKAKSTAKSGGRRKASGHTETEAQRLTRGQRDKVLGEVQNVKTSHDRLMELLPGRRVEVTAEVDVKDGTAVALAPYELTVKKMVRVADADKGRSIQFNDMDGKFHAVYVADVTRVR